MNKKQNVLTSLKNESCNNYFWNLIRNLDIFGITFNFRIDRQEKFQSTFGGLWLITFLILAISLYSKTIIYIYNYNEYLTYYYEKSSNISNTEEYLNLENERFDFGISIVYDKTVFPDNPFIIKGYYTELNENTNFNEYNIELKSKKCNPNMFTTHYDEKSKKTKETLSSMTCYDKSNYTIGGSEFADYNYYFGIGIFINENINSTKVLDLIHESNPLFQIIYPELIVNFDDYNQFQIEPNHIFTGLQNDQLNIIDFYLARNIYEQDMGIVFEKLEKFHYAKYLRSAFRSKEIYSTNDLIKIGYLNIKASNFYKVNQKYITKLVTVLQLQLTHLLNYFVAFKIIATMINFKIGKDKLIKELFEVDKEFLIKLKKLNDFLNQNINLDIEENQQEKEKKCENLNDLINKSDVIIKNQINTSKIIIKEELNNFMFNKNSFQLDDISIKFNEKIIDKNNHNSIISNDISKIEKNSYRNLLGKIVEINNQDLKEKDSGKNHSNDSSFIKIIKKEINKNKNEYDQNFLEFDKILDISYFVKKNHEVDLLKYLLLDENTVYLFNFLSGKVNLFDEKQELYDFREVEIQELLKKNIYNVKKCNKDELYKKKMNNLFEKYLEHCEK